MAFFTRTPPPPQPQPDAAEPELTPGEGLISLRHLEKSYAHGATRTWVLRRVAIDIKDGEFVSIMGPSGAGKSTLLHIIGMHDSAWTGDYFFGGHPVHRLNPKDRARLHKQYIGFVFQSYHLLDHLTVYENLDVPLSYRDIRKADRDSMVCDVLDRFNIVGKKDLYPNQLSGGQQQLIAVARAVIANPKVILADEPTGNLHSSQGREIMELFKKLNDSGHDDRAGDAFGSQRRIRVARDRAEGRMGGELIGVPDPARPLVPLFACVALLWRVSAGRARQALRARRTNPRRRSRQAGTHDQARRHCRSHAGHDDDLPGGQPAICSTAVSRARRSRPRSR